MSGPIVTDPGRAPPPVGTPGWFLDTAGGLARELSPAAQAALAASWPKDGPPPAVVAHLLSIMCADALACVSKGFVRMQHQPSSRPAKPPPPVSDGLPGEASLRLKND